MSPEHAAELGIEPEEEIFLIDARPKPEPLKWWQLAALVLLAMSAIIVLVSCVIGEILWRVFTGLG